MKSIESYTTKKVWFLRVQIISRELKCSYSFTPYLVVSKFQFGSKNDLEIKLCKLFVYAKVKLPPTVGSK